MAGPSNKFVTIEVNQYQAALKNKAENLVLKEFPLRIVTLNDLLTKVDFGNVNMSMINQDLNIPVPWNEPRAKRRRMTDNIMTANTEWPKVYTLPNGPSPCNKFLRELMSIIKPHIRQLVEDSILLKTWIINLLPKIEDGNCFESIQGATLSEIQHSEAKAEEFLERISAYFANRAKLVSKVAKYPHIEDYRRAVEELDEEEFLSLWLTISEIRHRYCVLHNLVSKNMDKINTPRTSNLEALY